MSLVVIHITDIHMVEEESKNPVMDKIQSICRACHGNICDGDDVVLAITGDLANRGKEEEYEVFKKFLDEIVLCLFEYNIDPYIAIVPGNHDVDCSGDQSVRNALIDGIKLNECNCAEGIVKSISTVQENFNSFSKKYIKDYDENSIIAQTTSFQCASGHIMLLMLNTAWKSEVKEKPGKLYMPINLLPNILLSDYDLVIAFQHHPNNWIQPDNMKSYEQYLRSSVDLLLIGHEHRTDEVTHVGHRFSLVFRNGKELQDVEKADSSSFSIYIIDNASSSIRTLIYEWQENMYRPSSDDLDYFNRNQMLQYQVILPNAQTMEYVNDLGLLVHHFRGKIIKLRDIYCWPDLELINLNIENNKELSTSIRVTSKVPETIFNNDLTLILGDSLAGKTSLAKMLFQYSINNLSKYCVFCNGEEFKSYFPQNVQSVVEMNFCNQYSSKQLEEYKQMSDDQKIIIVDDFEKIPFSGDKRSKIIKALLAKSGKVILLSDMEFDISSLFITNIDDKINAVAYRILNFGNVKREELIRKWFYLGEPDGFYDNELEHRILKMQNTIDDVLGNYRKLVPAVPATIISLIQTTEGNANASQNVSQYGYLYERLISASLSSIPDIDSSTLDIYVELLSKIAFDMLEKNTIAFSDQKLIDVVNVFNAKKKVLVDAGALIKTMIHNGILIKDISNYNRFRYPYIFYYFAGKYISEHISDPSVVILVEHMSESLHNEIYGNVMIFVCHFANSLNIIQAVIEKADKLLTDIEPFDYENPGPILANASKEIEKVLIPSYVGQETDVLSQRKRKLIKNDIVGINDGTVKIKDTAEIEDNSNINNRVNEVISAFKTIDVLGQIIKNYPGKFDGDVKLSIISSIYSLGMRSVQVLLDLCGYLQEDLIKVLAEQAKDNNRTASKDEIVLAVKNMFSQLLASVTMGMINKIAYSIGNEHLLIAADEALASSGSITGRLVMYEMQFNVLHKNPIEEVIKFNNELNDSRYTLASLTLKAIIAKYLKYNECGNTRRDKLCSTFSLSKTKLLIASVQNVVDKK